MGLVLYDNKKSCCGCEACANICPKDAITMELDEWGFSYPTVNLDKCVSCGMCKKVCLYQNSQPMHEPLRAYAAVNKMDAQLEKSASGGVFAAAATFFLKNDGVVFGTTLDFEDGVPIAHIVKVDDIGQLKRLQGSKYVQSCVNDAYRQAKKSLDQGEKVLFSGTPCQIAGLYGYLNKNYKNLWTMDVICHGVPNLQFFRDYLRIEQEKKGGIPVDYSFRDKKHGWGMTTRLDLMKDTGETLSIYSPARLTSYNTLFLDANTYRENCYSCPFACKKRVSDITIGDFWGIEIAHPELLKKDEFDEKKGISCLLVNTEKGRNLCEKISDAIYMYESSFDKISKRNEQLIHPSARSNCRETVMEIYRKNGYKGVEVWFHKKYRKQIAIHTIYNTVPRKLRIMLKVYLKRGK